MGRRGTHRWAVAKVEPITVIRRSRLFQLRLWIPLASNPCAVSSEEARAADAGACAAVAAACERGGARWVHDAEGWWCWGGQRKERAPFELQASLQGFRHTPQSWPRKHSLHLHVDVR